MEHKEIVNSKFDFDESLRRLNELWTLTLEDIFNYVNHIEETKSLFNEIRSQGYKMILTDKLKPNELSILNETGRKNALEIKRIQLEKEEVLKNKVYESAARLRVREKDLVNEVLDSYFGNPSIHFIYQNPDRKEIFCRPAHYQFQVPNFIFDWTT